MSYHNQQPEAVAVLEAAIQEVQARARAVQQQQQQPPLPRGVPDFVPSGKFEGRRPGYYYSRGSKGLGYYIDPRQPAPTPAGGAGPGDGDAEDGAGGEEAPAPAQPLDGDELLRQAEEAAQIDEVQLLDARSLRKLVHTLERKATENLQLRAKYAGEPLRFLDNEVDLLSIVRSLGQVAGTPSLYPVLVDSGGVAALTGLLGHENTDIVTEVLELFKELTEADAVEAAAEEAGSLLAALIEANALELLVESLERLDEGVEEEAAGVNNCLAILENMIEVKGEVADAVLGRTKLLKWLLGRIRRRASDANKQYAAEMLAILVQGRPAAVRALADANGVDALLLCANGFKARDPVDSEEAEFLENAFGALCSCLLLSEVRATFVSAEGVELMVLLLKGKRSARFGALKTLDFATTRYPPASERLIDAGGLGSLFAVFMGRTKLKPPPGQGGSGADLAEEAEERCVSILANMFQALPKGTRRDRLASKFVEAEFEKTDRLMELLHKYHTRVMGAEERLKRRIEEGALDPEEDEDAILVERMDAGLFHLQLCSVVALHLWATGDAGLRKRLLALLHTRTYALEDVRDIVAEYYVLLGDEADGEEPGFGADERERQRRRLGKLVAGLGLELSQLEAAAASRAAARAGADANGVAGGRAAPAAEAGQGEGAAGEGEEEDDMELDAGGPGVEAPAPAPAPPPPEARAAAAGNGAAAAPRDSPRAEPGATAAAAAAGGGGGGGGRERSRSRERERGPRGEAGAAAVGSDREGDRRGREERSGRGSDRPHRERSDRDKERSEKDRSDRDRSERERSERKRRHRSRSRSRDRSRRHDGRRRRSPSQ